MVRNVTTKLGHLCMVAQAVKDFEAKLTARLWKG